MSAVPLLLVLSHFTAGAWGQYRVGLCRPHLIKEVYDTTVTLDSLVEDGDYTVMYTSGLKQYSQVTCARMGYQRVDSSDGDPVDTDEEEADLTDSKHQFYTYVGISKEGIGELRKFDIKESTTHGKFKLQPHESEDPDYYTLQYVAYKMNSVMLLYWCTRRKFVDDNFDDNIWIIVAKTADVHKETTKKDVLDMLHHDDFRSLIDNDMETSRLENKNTPRYIQLPPCHPHD